MPEPLTLELLERLNQKLRGVGAAIADRWEPGLTRQQMDALTEPYGFRLPDEAALWWSWHNGAGTAELTSSRQPRTLESAMANFQNLEGGMSDAWGLTRLVPVVSGQPWMWFDCRGPSEALVPVYAGYKAEEPWVAAGSIGEMVRILIAALETGAYTTDERGEWNEPDWDKVVEELDESGIV